MTKAIILAAGQGTRLRPLTNDRPKCLVSLIGKPLLLRQVETLNRQGVNDIHIATGYRADQIEKLGFNTSFNDKYDKTNMVESLFSAVEYIKSCKEDLIIAYGDIIYSDINLNKLLNSDDEINLMIDQKWRDLWSLRLENPLEDAETLLINEEGLITEIGKKPENYSQIQGQYTGLIKIRADKIEGFISFYNSLEREAIYDGNNFENMYMTSFLQLLINDSWSVKATNVESGWLEIDTTEDLMVYESMAKSGKLSDFIKLS